MSSAAVSRSQAPFSHETSASAKVSNLSKAPFGRAYKIVDRKVLVKVQFWKKPEPAVYATLEKVILPQVVKLKSRAVRPLIHALAVPVAESTVIGSSSPASSNGGSDILSSTPLSAAKIWVSNATGTILQRQKVGHKSPAAASAVSVPAPSTDPVLVPAPAASRAPAPAASRAPAPGNRGYDYLREVRKKQRKHAKTGNPPISHFYEKRTENGEIIQSVHINPEDKACKAALLLSIALKPVGRSADTKKE